MNQDARRKNVSFGDAPVARIVRVPSLQDMSQAEITEKYYAKGDFGEFARSEISRRRALGIRSMAALCPAAEDLRVYVEPALFAAGAGAAPLAASPPTSPTAAPVSIPRPTFGAVAPRTEGMAAGGGGSPMKKVRMSNPSAYSARPSACDAPFVRRHDPQTPESDSSESD